MNRNTLLYLGLGIGAYYFLSTRQPVFAIQADGSYLPATFLDRLTVALTGVQPPPSQGKSVSVSLPGFDATYGTSGLQLKVQ